jgi:hypothetical protein
MSRQHGARETGRRFLESNMKAILGGLVLAALHVAASVAAPRAESALECGVAADMAVVADSLAREQIDHGKAGAIMAPRSSPRTCSRSA